ncbi:hypothetical protein E2C01_061395 [Portunus trituberculatus]|uniref:Uncharacterized protein n=1 Tax=Portunus trituberculatus TaxID=210409 RepID=A0A5B7HB63_PORTR|nr:hypothetical protein [Portunus trituberculatus]
MPTLAVRRRSFLQWRAGLPLAAPYVYVCCVCRTKDHSKGAPLREAPRCRLRGVGGVGGIGAAVRVFIRCPCGVVENSYTLPATPNLASKAAR